MGAYFITGPQGSGKTTVINALADNGYTAYNIEAIPGVVQLQDLKSGEFLSWPNGRVDWNRTGWNMQEEPVDALLSSDQDVFLGAVTSNQKQFYHKFNTIFALIVDPDTLKRQLLHHEHQSHRDPVLLAELLARQSREQQEFIDDGAVPIVGGRSLSLLIKDILAHTRLG